jgi:hypothetical protein
MSPEKGLVIAKLGVARSKIHAMSGAGSTIWTHWKPGDAMAKSQIN